MKKIHLIKNKSEIGAGTRGASMGIDAMEVAALNIEKHFFNKYSCSVVKNENKVLYKKTETKFAKNIKAIYNVHLQIIKVLENIINLKNFPIIISGDHSSASGTIAGLKKIYSNKNIGVIWIDAHGDLHSPYTTPSGNVHGMPLAIALAKDNLKYKKNDIDNKTKTYWENLKNIAEISPKIKSKDLIMFGVRDLEKPETELIKELKIKNYTVEEMRFKGLDLCLKEAEKKLSHCDLIYISFDVDSMDCNVVSKGTGTPVEKGFYPKEVLKIMEYFIKTKKVKCLEFVEINPTLDNKKNKMAETAFDILQKLIASIENNK